MISLMEIPNMLKFLKISPPTHTHVRFPSHFKAALSCPSSLNFFIPRSPGNTLQLCSSDILAAFNIRIVRTFIYDIIAFIGKVFFALARKEFSVYPVKAFDITSQCVCMLLLLSCRRWEECD